MNGPRRGPVIGATWLIGLGIVFIVQRSMGWTWSEAWPLFLILIGVASGVSALVGGLRGPGGLWGLTWPVAWVVVGSLLLASTTGSLGTGPGELVATYWPWFLVILGIWFLIGAFVPGGRVMESLVIPLGDAQRAQVRVKFGAGELVTHVAAPGDLVDGTFRGGVRHRTGGPGRVDLEQDLEGGLPWVDGTSSWDLGLTAEVPLDLRLETGAYRGTIDLADLKVASLELQTGASETRVRLPRAAGMTSVRAESGAASVILEVPTGVAARIRSRMALGSTRIDEARFPRVGDLYQSIDYATAPNRVEIDIQGGVGSIQVVGTA